MNGWKDIASELNRSVRTVQRWERELQLPVHRLPKVRKAPVFAFKDEIGAWQKTLERKPVQQIIASIQRFLSLKPEGKPCSHCNSEMKHIDATFWLNGTNNEWKVSIPFCPRCEPELLKRSPRTIQ
jgi:hypothetical protein